MFFDNLLPRSRAQLKQLPPIPETGWRPPKEFPRLSEAVAIGFDCEVKENDFEHGPGWARKQASITGFSLDGLWSDGSTHSWYFPIRHEVEPEYNLDPEKALAFLADTLKTNIPKFGANLLYDIGNATDERIQVHGDLHDCQFAEALLEEDGLVDLDYLGKKYLGVGKETSLVYQWLADAYGGKPTSSQRTNLYRCSPRLVGPYAEVDAKHPRRILSKQWSELVKQQLYDLYRMECELIPLLIEMRRVGTRVDLDRAAQMHVKLSGLILESEKKIHDLTGLNINVNSGKELAPAYDKIGVKYPYTEAGNPSFTAPWFLDQHDPLSELVLETRQYYKLRDTFIQSYILESHVNGRIHCQFHPLRSDAGGTRSGRFSSSTPNLQNIPSRSALGKLLRQIFVPDVGHLCWEKGDYSQIEYRALMHYAVGPKSDEFRDTYNREPKTDYHKFTQKVLYDSTGIYIPRKAEEAAAGKFKTGRLTIKEINFGFVYAMGVKTLCANAHCDYAEGKKASEAYHKAMPFIRPTIRATSDEAQRLGFITTILGRRSRFNLWEPEGFPEDGEERKQALEYGHAIRVYGSRIQRAHTHKALNRRLQGSAADVIKSAMHRCWKAGVYAVIGVPRNTVHDENSQSVIDESKEQTEAYEYMHWVMENIIKMRVPLLFESGRGPNWGAID